MNGEIENFEKNFYERIKKKNRNLKNENHVGDYNIL